MAMFGVVITTDDFPYETHDEELVRLIRLVAEKLEKGIEQGVLVDRAGKSVGTFVLA